MRFDHTKREVPKYGASKRDAESSTASEQAPATKTSKMSSQPCMLRPAVWATAPSSARVSRELGVVVDKENLSFYSGGTYIVVRDSFCLTRV